jgi:GMP synthase (glutamine-hydrolysing)
VLQHVPHETCGLITEAAGSVGVTLRIIRLWDGDAVPSADDVAGAVVLGGPMGALDDAAHPHLAAERELLRQLLAGHVPVLGICLGAQLLAVAAGGRLVPGAAVEVGAGEVRTSQPARHDPVFGVLGERQMVLHWHADTFELPSRAVRLASTALCRNQAFRIGSAYGLQFHIEIDEGWLEIAGPHLPDGVTLGPRDVDSIGRSGLSLLSAFFRQAQSAAAHTHSLTASLP